MRSIILHMVMKKPGVTLLLLATSTLCAQSRWFQPSLLETPEVRKARDLTRTRASSNSHI